MFRICGVGLLKGFGFLQGVEGFGVRVNLS